MNLLIGLAVFIFTVLLIEGVYLFSKNLRDPEKKTIRKRLRDLAAEGYTNEEIVKLLRERSLSEVPWLNRLLFKIPLMKEMDFLLQKSGSQQRLGVFFLLTLLMFILGYVLGTLLTKAFATSIICAFVSAALPFLYIKYKKRQRMDRFQKQLPDALDLIARALKAGHAFSGGLRMISDEFGDPIGTEFGKVMDELNFGVGLADALRNLAKRVECPDLKFFIISVLIQRETGGNLAEILENIGFLIRERFKLFGRIRTLAAEGKLSAIVLICLPFFVTLFLYFFNRVYISALITDPIGRIMTFVSLCLMLIGAYVMARMIKIKV